MTIRMSPPTPPITPMATTLRPGEEAGVGLGLGVVSERGVELVPFLPPRICTADILVNPMLYLPNAARRASSFRDNAADSSCSALSRLTVVGTLTVPDKRRRREVLITANKTRT